MTREFVNTGGNDEPSAVADTTRQPPLVRSDGTALYVEFNPFVGECQGPRSCSPGAIVTDDAGDGRCGVKGKQKDDSGLY
jgi:hypothetical protein